MSLKRVQIQLTDELLEAIDTARGNISRGRWVETKLRQLSQVKKVAKLLGVEFPDRPRVGTYDREPLKGKPRGTRIHEAE